MSKTKETKNTYSINLTRKVVDISATSCRLKQLRIEHGYSVKDLYRNMGLESASAIYQWENKENKKIPCLENLDFLARLYGLHIEDLYVTRDVGFSDLEVQEPVSMSENEAAIILKDLTEAEKEEFFELMGDKFRK